MELSGSAKPLGREALTNAGLLLAGTKRMVIATGIANIYARDAVAMAPGRKHWRKRIPIDFCLGLGVSHVPLVEQLRGHRYEKPVATMRAYWMPWIRRLTAPFLLPQNPRVFLRRWGRRCWSFPANAPTARILTT